MSKHLGSWPERKLLFETNFRNGWCRIPFTVAAILSRTRIGFGDDPRTMLDEPLPGFELYAERKDLTTFWHIYNVITLHRPRLWLSLYAERIGYRIYRWRKEVR